MKSRTAFTKCWQIYSPLLRSSFCRLRPLAGKLCTGHASAICLPMQQTLLVPDWPPASSPAWLSLPGRRCSQSVLRHRPVQRQCRTQSVGEDWVLLPPPRVPPAAIRSPRGFCLQACSSAPNGSPSSVQKIVSSGAMLTLAHEGIRTTPLGCLRPSAAGIPGVRWSWSMATFALAGLRVQSCHLRQP